MSVTLPAQRQAECYQRQIAAAHRPGRGIGIAEAGPAMNAYHQVAVQLEHGAFEILKQHSKATRKPYAAVIAEALALLATSTGKASQPLVEASQPLVYATLDIEHQSLWKKKVRELREGGRSYAGISKTLFQEFQLSGQDGLPLNPSTIRSICSL